MKTMTVALVLLLATPLLAAPPSNDAAPAIAKLNPEFMAAANAGDAARLAAFYTDDAFFMPPGAPAQHGHDAIRAAWAAFFSAGKATVTLTTDTIIQSCDLATEIGHYTASGAINEKGKYAVTWRKVDGRWLIAVDIFNSDSAPAPAPH